MTEKETDLCNAGRNDLFSTFRGLDLQELLVEIENTYLSYRDTLGLDGRNTIGIEIEYEKLGVGETCSFLAREALPWVVKSDESIPDGAEINSPIVHDEKKTWLELKKICEFLKQKKVDTCHHAGGHFHLGAHVLGENIEAWRQFCLAYLDYEPILFRFFYGDKVNAREDMSYARKTSLALYPIPWRAISNIEDLRRNYAWTRKFTALSFLWVCWSDIYTTTKRNTIEFRSPNATVEEVVWQNNINAGGKLLQDASFERLDEDFLSYKYKMISHLTEDFRYDEVCLKDALEFVDLVFDNNLDKVYFLRQYFKGFEEGFRQKGPTLAKKFVR